MYWVMGWVWTEYQNHSNWKWTGVSVICLSKAENADRGLNNSDILRKPNSIMLLLFILQEKSAMRIRIKKCINLGAKPVSFYSDILKFMRESTEKICEHRMDIKAWFHDGEIFRAKLCLRNTDGCTWVILLFSPLFLLSQWVELNSTSWRNEIFFRET